jgi:hypothetical protein
MDGHGALAGDGMPGSAFYFRLTRLPSMSHALQHSAIYLRSPVSVLKLRDEKGGAVDCRIVANIFLRAGFFLTMRLLFVIH